MHKSLIHGQKLLSYVLTFIYMSLFPILNVSFQPSKLQFAVTKAKEFVKGHKILSCDISVFYIHVVILPYSSPDKIRP